MGIDKIITSHIEQKLKQTFLFNPFYQAVYRIAYWSHFSNSHQSFLFRCEKVNETIASITEQMQIETNLPEEQRKFLTELIRLANDLNEDSMQALSESIKKNAPYLPENWGHMHVRDTPPHSAIGEIFPHDAHQIGHCILAACPPTSHHRKRSYSVSHLLWRGVEQGVRSQPASRQATPEDHVHERGSLPAGSAVSYTTESVSTLFSSTLALPMPPCLESGTSKWYHLLASRDITHIFAVGEFSTNFFNYTTPGNHEGTMVRRMAESTEEGGVKEIEIYLADSQRVSILNLSMAEEGILPEEEGVLVKVLAFFRAARESNYLIHSSKSIGSASAMLLMLEIYEHLSSEPLSDSNTDVFVEWLIEKMTQMRQIRFSCTNIPQVMNAIACADQMVSLQKALELKDVELMF